MNCYVVSLTYWAKGNGVVCLPELLLQVQMGFNFQRAKQQKNKEWLKSPDTTQASYTESCMCSRLVTCSMACLHQFDPCCLTIDTWKNCINTCASGSDFLKVCSCIEIFIYIYIKFLYIFFIYIYIKEFLVPKPYCAQQETVGEFLELSFPLFLKKLIFLFLTFPLALWCGALQMPSALTSILCFL